MATTKPMKPARATNQPMFADSSETTDWPRTTLVPDRIWFPIHTGPAPERKLRKAIRHDASVALEAKANLAFEPDIFARSLSAHARAPKKHSNRTIVRMLLSSQFGMAPFRF